MSASPSTEEGGPSPTVPHSAVPRRGASRHRMPSPRHNHSRHKGEAMTRNSPAGHGSRTTMNSAAPRRTPNAKRSQQPQALPPARPRGRGPTQPDRLGNHRWPFFRRVLDALRANCPVRKPVTVHVGYVGHGVLGFCKCESHRTSIRVSGRLTQEAAVDVLVHEWAHAMSWDRRLDRLARAPWISATEFEAAVHGPAWGVAYARAYLVFVAEARRVRRERSMAARRKA